MKTQIISVANRKGGVGKTTTAFNVAAAMVQRGKRVLLVDFDPQGNLTSYIGSDNDESLTINDVLQASLSSDTQINVMDAIQSSAEGVDYIPSDISLSSSEIYMPSAFCREQILSKVLRPVVEACKYDYIVIDCLPSLGILLVNALTASDSVIVPVQAQKFALDGLKDFFDVFGAIKSNLNINLTICGLLITMMDNTNMAKEVELELPALYPNVKIFDTKISKSVEATNSTYLQKSLVSIKGSKLGAQYLSLADEIIMG